MTKVNCPVDGCDYGPRPVKSVASHYSGKKDDAHSGGYEKAMSMLESDGGSKPDTDGTDGQTGSPNQDDGPTFPEASSGDNGGTDTSEAPTDLPCGHESFDPSEAPDPPFRVQCDTCGASWTVTDE